MSAEKNKAIARRVREELWTTASAATAQELYAADAVFHHNDPMTPDFGRGPEAARQTVTLYRTAFPDARCAVEEIIAEGDLVAVRWTARATHQGQLGATAATGKQVTVTGIDIYRFEGGKIKEETINWDTLGMFHQLGVAGQIGQAAG